MTSQNLLGQLSYGLETADMAGGTSEAIVSFNKLSLINGC